MPTRKIGDLPEPDKSRWVKTEERPCFHPEHDPPSMVVRPPGIYEHECPGCGRKITFVVQRTDWLCTTGPRTPETDDGILPWRGGCSAPWR